MEWKAVAPLSIPSDEQDRVMVLLSIERAAASGFDDPASCDLAHLATALSDYLAKTWADDCTKQLVREIGAKWGVLE